MKQKSADKRMTLLPGQSSRTTFDVGNFYCGNSHHENWRDHLSGIRPSRKPFPRELATTGMHGIVRKPTTKGKLPARTGHYGKSSRGNYPREFMGNFSQKAAIMVFHWAWMSHRDNRFFCICTH